MRCEFQGVFLERGKMEENRYSLNARKLRVGKGSGGGIRRPKASLCRKRQRRRIPQYIATYIYVAYPFQARMQDGCKTSRGKQLKYVDMSRPETPCKTSFRFLRYVFTIRACELLGARLRSTLHCNTSIIMATFADSRLHINFQLALEL